LNASRKFNNREIAKPTCSLAQLVAQAEGPRSGETDSRSDELLLLSESSTQKTGAICAFSLKRDFPRLSETFARSKPERVAWATLHAKRLGEPPLISPRRDRLAWARLSDLAAVPCDSHSYQTKPHTRTNQTFRTSHQP